jgi:2-polyprenyl-3-methyl-5-hydroxy-6-metoxy-1,4-benzoquinol methylase
MRYDQVRELATGELLATMERSGSARERAVLSRGASDDRIYAMVARELRARHRGGGTLIDVGCGAGHLFPFVKHLCDRYIGIDVVRYAGFPEEAEFVEADLNAQSIPLPEASAELVVSVETIEHLENPRSFLKALSRVATPGGYISVTTPNQLSLLSKLCLVLKNQFPAFQEAPGLYPAHITALLEIDLLRLATETGLQDAAIAYTDYGRIPGTPWHWPRPLRGRAFSDNVLLIARRPAR